MSLNLDKILTPLFLFVFFISSSRYVYAFKNINEAFISKEEHIISLDGDFEGGQFGNDIVIGDFNGDNIDDMAVSSPLSNYEDRQWNGSVKVIFGYDNSSQDIDSNDYSLDQSNNYNEIKDYNFNVFNIYGKHSGDQLGRAMTVGDFNFDGIDDLVIGAHNAIVNSRTTGQVYIIYGKVDMGSQSLDLLYNKPDVQVDGFENGEAFGLSLLSSDFDNNGMDDLIIGAPFSGFLKNKETGAAYLFLNLNKSKDDPFSNIPRVFWGHDPGERFASEISGGDLNFDGFEEIIIGAYKNSSKNHSESGSAYIYHGREFFPLNIKLADIKISGSTDYEWFGFSIDTADINNDKFYDLAISSFPYKGSAYDSKIDIFTGNEEYVDENYSIRISNSSTNVFLASDLKFIDIDSNQSIDLIAGTPNINNPDDFSGAGKVYIFQNLDSNNSKELDISTYDFSTVIHGNKPNEWFGSKIATIDINNDKNIDIAISSIYADSKAFNDNGRVDVMINEGNTLWGQKMIVSNESDNEISRGELAKVIIDEFDLSNKKQKNIEDCHQHIQFCLFNFTAMSSYENIQLEPKLLLYPDVDQNSDYYNYINDATILGFMNGYLNQKMSPFKPKLPITRVQALKSILSANDLVNQKYKFEFTSSYGKYKDLTSQKSYFSDVDPNIEYMWWYPRYINFAVENNIVDYSNKFRPDEYLTRDELDDLISRTLDFLNSQNAQIDS